MTDYTYNISNFSSLGSPLSINNISLLGLQQQVDSSSITSTQLSYVSINESDIIFTFNDALSGSPDEVSVLDSIVADHDGSFQPEATGDTILSYSFADKDGTPLKTLNSTYTRSATIVFEGTSFYDATPVEVQVSGYVEGTAVGAVRLYDLDNDIVLGEITINNTSEQVLEMEITEDWSEEQTTIEFQMKRISGLPLVDNLVITSVQIIF